MSTKILDEKGGGIEKGEKKVDGATTAIETEEKAPQKTEKKKEPLEMTWQCVACKKVNPCYQKIPGSKLLIDVEACSLCQTERPTIVGLDDDGPSGPTAAELAAQRAEAMKQAMKAGIMLSRTEGIIPAIETAHAFAALNQMSFNPSDVVVINLSGRGDKDLDTYIQWGKY